MNNELILGILGIAAYIIGVQIGSRKAKRECTCPSKTTQNIITNPYGDFAPNPVSHYPIITSVLDLMEKHVETWRDQPERYWAYRLSLEVIDLIIALMPKHRQFPEYANQILREIASICLNWLDMRLNKNG